MGVGAPWPAVNGGKVRTARLATYLASIGDVTAVHAGHDNATPAPAGITSLHYRARRLGRVGALLSPDPRQGTPARGMPAALADRVAQHDFVVYAKSHVAACLPYRGRLGTIVDFADVDTLRHARDAGLGTALTMRIGARLDALKARRWEPRVAAWADACLAVSPEDAQWIADHGGTVIRAPHGIDAVPYVQSPRHGGALLVASMHYAPNRDGARWVIERVWPRVRRQLPGATLTVAGLHAATLETAPGDSGIRIVNSPPSMEDLYRGAAVVLAPVSRGGGAQLKVTEALAHHRALVTNAFSAAPHGLCPPPAAVPVTLAETEATFAQAIVDALDDAERRWTTEQDAALRAGLAPWSSTLAGLGTWMRERHERAARGSFSQT